MIYVIGDVHGKYDQYTQLIRDLGPESHTIQLGDMGFRYDHMASLDRTRHCFFKGNHDNYREESVYDLGDYGEITLGGVTLFFVRGAYSIDRYMRREGIDWFPEEELTIDAGYDAISQWTKSDARTIITHDCPHEVLKFIYDYTSDIKVRPPTRTGQLLNAILDARQPDLWVFGHHHRAATFRWGKCMFVGIPELGVVKVGP